MITQLESNIEIRKKLGNLMPKERIIWVCEPKETLDLIIKLQKKINLVIANFNTPYFYEVVKKNIFEKIYRKLKISPIPLFGYYAEEDEKIRELIGEHHLKAVFYETKNPEFAFKYLKMAKENYPEIRVIEDKQKIMDVWLAVEKEKELSKKERNSIEKIIREIPVQNLKDTEDYKIMYERMKKERDEWRKKYENLINSIKKCIEE